MSALYIEVLDNLQVVDIYAKLGADGDAAADNGVQLAGEADVKVGSHAPIKLPVTVYPQKATTVVLPPSGGDAAARWVRTRVPIDHCSRKARLDAMPQAIARIDRPATAASIGALEDVWCQACGASLVVDAMKRADSPCNIRDLPSAHWNEMVDCWLCHPEEDSLNVNPELMFSFEPEKGPAPAAPAPDSQPGTGVHMWVGNMFVLVPVPCTRGLSAKLVALDDKDRFDNAFSPLQCDSCASVVGEAGRVGRRQTAKMYLHRIGLRNAESTIEVSLSQAICSELLSHAGAHAVYKYVLEGRVSCRPAALVHLVGWNAEIMASSMAATGGPHGAPAFERCVKVLFLGPRDAGFESMSKQWLDDEAVELVSLLDEDCALLLELLEANSRRVPPQLRTMSGMTRSFLTL
ncbi:hypothetical protein LPJ61_001087 [Coemansia biformis]|uniref:Ubiquitin-conjugating enzyme E2-binding protein n=1 Tax=Coemansia biformis TaxID=1286918 RepID=A0A9W7YH33_9FUNG|nr:hypothetical protein LPJ61_001087 [Coemansia biformis]